MKTTRPHVVLFALASLCALPLGRAATELRLLGVAGQPRETPAISLVAGQESTLELEISATETSATADFTPVFRQLGGAAPGAIAAPVSLEAALLPAPADARVVRLRIRSPEVARVTRFALWLGRLGPVSFTVFPADRPRADLAPLADALASSGLRLAVCGSEENLRAHLRAEKIEFADLGASAPDHIAADTLLVGRLLPEELERLAALPGGPLLAFVDEPALLPGVYARQESVPRRSVVKVTLPLPPLLATDPRARETLHRLLLTALTATP